MTQLAQKITELYTEQSKDWPLFSSSLNGLSEVQHKELVLDNDKIKAQFNAARMISTSAKIDSKSIDSRPCFLCAANRPAEQKAVEQHDSEYLFLVNPFPVIEKHFTVVHKKHIRQQLVVSDYLSILNNLGPDWALIYNGAKAGASAPDHLHFQVVPSFNLPLYASLNSGKADFTVAKQIFVFAGMPFVMINSDSVESITESADQIINKIADKDLLNVVGWKQGLRFTCFIMPRMKHRPDCYFRQDLQQLLVSPAAMELSGIWIFPREKDYKQISQKQLESIAREVTLSIEQVKLLL